MMKILLTCLERAKMKIAVISVTKAGDEISERLKTHYDLELYSKNNINNFNLKEITKEVMKEYKAVVFISSTGIAVRAIADQIKSKDIDPAVIVIDSSCRFVISLLSGHLGGANDLSLDIANILESTPVITTATDNLGIKAPDLIAKENELIIDSLKDAKDIAALLVDKKKVAFMDERALIDIPKGYREGFNDMKGLVYVTHHEDISPLIKKISLDNKNLEIKSIKTLKLIRRDIVLGIGCRKNFEAKKMLDTVKALLREKNIDIRAVCSIATVEVKAKEEAILKLAEKIQCRLDIFSLEEIKKIDHKYTGSDFVEKTIGVRSVCEPCVELSKAVLLTDKIKAEGMTLCIGELIITKRMC